MTASGGKPGDGKAIKAALRSLAADEREGVYQAAIDAIAEDVSSSPDLVESVLAETAPEFALSPVVSIVDETWLAGAAILDQRILHADPGLDIAPGGEGLENLRRLAARAARAPRAFAMLRLADGSLAVAVAARGEQAAAWPLGPEVRAALGNSGRATAVLAFAPGSEAGLEGIIANAFGLNRSEARLGAVLFRGLGVDEAAGEIGMTVGTARKTARSLLRKTGTLRRAGLTARIAELLAGHYLRVRDRAELIQEAFSLSAAEARVAEAVAHGLTVREIADRRRVSAHTVRTQLNAALLKTGIARASDLARILVNLCALVSWTSCSEPQRQDQRLLIAATRMIPAEGTRRIAAADYGPAKGAPVLSFHPGLSYRWVRRRLREAFQARGFRTLCYDRAGCGLSDIAEGNVLDLAADDAARVLDRFRVERTRIFASFGGAAPAVAFAARHPDRVAEAVLLMPRPSRSITTHPSSLKGLWHAFAERPGVADSFYNTVRLAVGSRFWRWLQAQVARGTPADRATMRDDAYNDERIAEIYASFARTARGTLDLDRAYRTGWPRPERVGGTRWTIVTTAASPSQGGESDADAWGWLPGLQRVALPQAGRFAMHTHADEIAACFAPPAS
ncbi:hypothetical protein sos41_22400 [Alphaproteobacteria bacterium SO-S41]|nr:hypothetical protein sos41_22400 [Alphaproteobacteria bacterium SO-S41]